MANDQVDFELWLRSKFDGDALKGAQAEFRRTQKSAEDAGEGMKSAGTGAAAGLKAALGELVAIAAILGQLKEGFAEVTAQEQAFNRLSDAAARFGGNAGEVNAQFEKLAKTIQEKSGLDDDALYLAMVKVYQATGDMNEALGQAALAADVARGANIPLEQALSTVNGAALGNTRSLRELGISVATTGDKAVDAKAGLDALGKAFGGSAANAKGATVELGKLKEEWGNVRNDFISGSGEMLTGVLKFVNLALQPLFISLQLAGNSIKTIIASVREFGGVIGSIIAGDWKGAREGLAKTKDTLVAGFENAFEIIKARAEKMWATINGTTGGAIEAPKAKGTGKGGGPDPTAAAKKALEEREKQEELEFKFEQGLIKGRAKAHADMVANKKKINDAALADDKRRLKDLNKAQQDAADIEIAMAERTAKIKEDLERHVAMMKEAVANQAMALGDAVFGQAKEWAIAQAIISTYQGAAGALAMQPWTPYNFALAALVIATGIAQVAKIVSTEPSTKGSGFDDPRNDREAFIGGRRWAADMIGEFTSGVSAGWASGMGGGGRSQSNVTYDNRSTMNLHMNVAGFLDPSDTQQMAKFARNLAVVNKTVEGQRRTARTAR